MPSSPTERRGRVRRAADRVGEAADSTYRYRVYMYVALVLWTAFIFWRMGENQETDRAEDRLIVEQIEYEALARDYAICLRGNELRQANVAYISGLAAQSSNPTAAQVIVDQARKDFAPVECPPVPEPPRKDDDS